MEQLNPSVALMCCGSTIDEFYNSIGVSFETLRTDLTGGWTFNYIEALKKAGVKTVFFLVSSQLNQTLKFTHEPTGAEICILPTSGLHRAFRYVTKWKFLSSKSFIKSLDSYLVLPFFLTARELKRQKVQAIVFQDYENPSFDICVLLGRLIRLPVFATFQGGTTQKSKIEKYSRFLGLQACQGLLIGPTVEIQRVCTQYKIDASKIARIFNPMDVSAWHARERHEVRIELGISLTARVAVYHGRIDFSHKGVDILLEAWQKICEERPEQELCLLLVGTGHDAPEVDHRIKTLQIPGVLWINNYICDRSLLWKYLSSADVYVMASRHEGFPVAPIEAMACALPIVATDAPGIPDILESDELYGGLVVPREDSTALALALGKVLDNEEWGRDLGKRARHRVETDFSLEVVGKQMQEFLFTSH